MKLLMFTRKVDKDDALAGFAYNWVKEIGEKLDNLYVICLEKGNISGLPDNIKVYSLGKEKYLRHSHIIRRLILYYNFQKLAWQLIRQVDGVFCHMNPEYTILVAPYSKLFGKKLISWYTHKQVSWKLHLVNLLTDKILTASKESCRLKNRSKIEVVGHGIDTDYFTPIILSESEKSQKKSKFIILSVGRISPVKDYETLIETVDILVNNSLYPEVQIIGAPGLKKQEVYLEKLKKLVKEKDLEKYIKFLGPISHSQILPYYQKSDLFINLSATGSVDKAVLEAMACQVLVLTSNEAFKNILNDKRLIFEKESPQDLVKKIVDLVNLTQEEKERIGQQLRKVVIKDYNLDNLVNKIINQFL